jgi:hypothetical protein
MPPSSNNDQKRVRQRIHPRWEKEWPKWEKDIKKRLREGHRQYSDKSFDRPLSSLLREAEEEIYDQILWSFIALTRISSLWGRIQRLENAIGLAEVENRLLEEGDVKFPYIPGDPDLDNGISEAAQARKEEFESD